MTSEVQQVPPLTPQEVENILSHWSTLNDVCRDDPAEFAIVFQWPCDPNVCKDAFGESMVVKKTRDLPPRVAAEAQAYIKHLVSKYPYQLRAEMARPMWHRFLDMYADTGSRQKALRKI